MQKPVALVFAVLLAFGAIAVLPSASAAISIASMSSTTTDTNGGKAFTICGLGFDDEATVLFGTVPANKVVPCTPGSAPCTGVQPRLDVESPANAAGLNHAAGTITIKVTNPNGEQATLTGFTVTAAPAPRISSVNVN